MNSASFIDFHFKDFDGDINIDDFYENLVLEKTPVMLFKMTDEDVFLRCIVKIVTTSIN